MSDKTVQREVHEGPSEVVWQVAAEAERCCFEQQEPAAPGLGGFGSVFVRCDTSKTPGVCREMKAA